MNRRKILAVALAVSVVLTGCSTMRALGQVDQIGPVRQALVDYLPDFYFIGIRADLAFLDDTYAQVDAVLDRDPEINLRTLVPLILGSPQAFDKVGESYANIRGAVEKYHSDYPVKPIPAELVAFHVSVTPAYAELKAAINANDTVKLGFELATLLRPLVLIALR